MVGVGASQGLGAAIARRFAAGGHPVAIAGRNAPKLEATAAELAALERRRSPAWSAMRPIRRTRARFVAAAEALAPLAVAVHNAGGNRPAPFLKVSADDVRAALARARAGRLPPRPGRPSRAASDTAAAASSSPARRASLRGKANFAPFASAKAGLRNLAQSIAREFGPQNIHVGHVVVDGGIAGERLLSRMPGLADQRGPDGMLNIDAIAEAYWFMHHQQRSAWTLELDVRPWAENF